MKKTTETVDIQSLIQDDHNMNKGTTAGKQLMEKSFRELGAGRSILLDKDGRIIAGNKSQLAAIEAGITKVRVIETTGDELVAVKRTDVSLDDKKGRELALADNVTTQINLSWDQAELAAVGEEIPELNVADWGLDPKDLGIEQPTEPTEVQEDDFDETKDHIEPICQNGDIYQLGNHRLMCGDSTSAADVALLMDGEKADIWLTDPPYNVAYEGGTKEKLTIQNDNMSDGDFRQFLIAAYSAAFENMKEGASFYIWHADMEGLNFRGALLDVGQKMRECLIWNKNSLCLGRSDYQWKHEPCLYGWKNGASHNWYGDRKQTSVIDWDRPKRNEDHPTMKPVGLFAYQMQNSSKAGDIVLDTFGGSGTTIIAAEELGRHARVMELDPHYCDVIIARWEKLTGQKATKINNN